MRNTIAKGLLVVAVFACAPTSLPAQALYTKDDAARLLRQNVEHSSFSPIHGIPLHIVEKIHYTVGKLSIDGLKETFTAPDGRRDSFKVGDMGEIDWLSPGTRYTLRNGAPAFYLKYRLTAAEDAVHTYLSENAAIKSADAPHEGRICAELEGTLNKHVCFDASTGDIASFSMHPHLSGQTAYTQFYSSTVLTMDADEFSIFEGQPYARHVVLTFGNETVDIRYDTVEEVLHGFPADTFKPVAQATRWDVCEVLRGEATLKLDPHETGVAMMGEDILAGSKAKAYLFYVVVGTDGHAERYAPVYGGESYQNKTIETTMKDTQFPKKACDEKPIEYETLYRFIAR
jgi:hypothetical protein